jgi:hypothetical protein
MPVPTLFWQKCFLPRARAHLDDLADRLMTERARELGGDHSMRDVDIGETKTAGGDADQDFVRSGPGTRNVAHFPLSVDRGRHCGFHIVLL